MPKKSKINIFNKMKPEDLEEKLNDYSCSTRYYQRIIAMRLIEKGIPHKEVANILHVSYRSINRWAHVCENDGLEGLELNYTGGKKSKLTPEMRLEFQKYLKDHWKEGLTMTEAQGILKKNFGLDFSLGYVGEIVRSLNFNYGSAYPKFEEAEENPEKTLKKTLIWLG